MDNQQIQLTSSSRLNQSWRIFATAFGFTLFGLGGLIILSTLWFNFLRLVIWNKKQRHIIAQHSISLSFKFFLWVIKFLRVIDYQFDGLEKLKYDKRCLIIANHPSLLDVVLLTSVMPRCDCMVKESLLKNIFVNGVIKAAGYIPNTQADKMIQYCSEALAENGRILIFPEGTRTVPNNNITLQRGAANIALRCKVDIRIIHIQCNPPMLIKDQKWYHVPPKKAVFKITVGEKIAISDFADENITLGARKLTRYLTLKLSRRNNTNYK